MGLFDKMKRKPARRKNRGRGCLAAALAAVLLGAALCGCRAGAPESAPEPTRMAETEAAAETESAPEQVLPDTAMELLTPYMEAAPQFAFAAAWLGCRETGEDRSLDQWLLDTVPGLVEQMPFVLQLPEDRILGSEAGDVFLILPRDEMTSLSVNRVQWVACEEGVRPEVTEVLYRGEYGEPVLMIAGWEEYPYEADLLVCAVAGNGAQAQWCPAFGEYGGISVPYGEDGEPLVLDFTGYGGSTGWEMPGDAGWLAPTDEGLADTTWICGEWMLELSRGGSDPAYAGCAQLLYPEDGEYKMVCSGVWRMEETCLQLELSGGAGDPLSGSFPVFISPSGDNLYMEKSAQSTLPFFGEDCAAVELIRSYG